MLIATAVVGAGPPSLFVALEPLPEALVVELEATFPCTVRPAFMELIAYSTACESLVEVIV